MLVRSVFLGLVAALALWSGCDKGLSPATAIPVKVGIGGDAGTDANADDTAGEDTGGGTGADPDASAGADPDASLGVDAGAETSACPPPASDICADPPPSFMNTIAPILEARCNVCHDPNAASGPWPLQDWADVSAWALMIGDDLVTCTMPPPASDTKLPEAERQLLFAWLACGSPNN